MRLRCFGHFGEILVVALVIVERLFANLCLATGDDNRTAQGIIAEPSGTPGDCGAHAQARLGLPTFVWSRKNKGAISETTVIIVGNDVALGPVFQPGCLDEPLGFEVSKAEFTGVSGGLALSVA